METWSSSYHFSCSCLCLVTIGIHMPAYLQNLLYLFVSCQIKHHRRKFDYRFNQRVEIHPPASIRWVIRSFFLGHLRLWRETQS
jgi:hypothetical protein